MKLWTRCLRILRQWNWALMQWVGSHPFVVGTMGSLVGAAIVAIVLVGLMQQRTQAIVSTQHNSASLVALMSNDLEANFGIYDLLLLDAADSARDPRTQRLPADIRRKLLFGRVSTGAYLDDAFYADANGNIVESRDGRAYPGVNLADRDYFTVQHERSVGMYISDPIRSRTREGQYSIGLDQGVGCRWWGEWKLRGAQHVRNNRGIAPALVLHRENVAHWPLQPVIQSHRLQAEDILDGS